MDLSENTPLQRTPFSDADLLDSSWTLGTPGLEGWDLLQTLKGSCARSARSQAFSLPERWSLHGSEWKRMALCSPNMPEVGSLDPFLVRSLVIPCDFSISSRGPWNTRVSGDKDTIVLGSIFLTSGGFLAYMWSFVHLQLELPYSQLKIFCLQWEYAYLTQNRL